MQDNKITKNFTFNEMIASSTAVKYGIDNTPKEQYIIDNIVALCKDILQPLREEFGEPIIIGSCYRSTNVNAKVGGAKNSDHLYGAAADIHTKSDKPADNKKLFDLVVKLAKEGKIKNCRQIIWEYGNKKTGPDWIHISINHKNNIYKNNQIVYIGC